MDSQGELIRTHYCGELSEADISAEVTLMGWVDRTRDLGNLVFVDLRDRTGVVQVVASTHDASVFEKIKSARGEFVLAVAGKVVERKPDTVNDQIRTGKVEVRAAEVRVLNEAETPPFPIKSHVSAAEETRLRYRYLDMRRKPLQSNLALRHRVTLETRKFLDGQGFLEIETPFLTRSTPEGARDYLVPSRLHPGRFYALPQSPQIFKQLLMIAGFDRYFQIVRCFRDEDLRADRQPEFSQIDIELSFPTEETVFSLVEELLSRLAALIGVEPERPFPRLSWAQAMARFGSDRPDTRFGLELQDLSDAFAGGTFQVFSTIVAEGGRVKGLCAPAAYSRGDLDKLAELVRADGAQALSWVVRGEGQWRSSLPKAVPQAELQMAAETAGLAEGETLLIVAGGEELVHKVLGNLRLELAGRHELIPDDRYNFLWVCDFPLLEWDEEEDRFFARHHPFTSPREEDLEKLETDPASVQARAYDVVLNGTELGGGSIRIHRSDVQQRVFASLGIETAEADSKFGFLLEALRFGAPPHGGIALGLDRIVMLLAGARSLRDVIAFPKTARALDLMCDAPSEVDRRQLEELFLAVTQPPAEE